MGFSLEVMDTEMIKKEINDQVNSVAQEESHLQSLAEKNVQEIISVDLNSLAERKKAVDTVKEFASDILAAAAKRNKLLQNVVGTLSKRGKESGQVSASLLELQKEIKKLDPSQFDFEQSGLWAKLFNPAQSYFDKYHEADAVISNIISALNQGKERLQNDNTTLEIEEVAMRNLTKQLKKKLELGALMDEELSKQIVLMKERSAKSDKIEFVQAEILYLLRQQMIDLEQMLAVNQQGIMALQIVRRNNQELIRGVDRAVNVTVSALRIAVLVASARYNQKIILNSLQSLTTDDLESNQANLSLEELKSSFVDVRLVLEEIKTYKQEVVPEIEKEISALNDLAE